MSRSSAHETSAAKDLAFYSWPILLSTFVYSLDKDSFSQTCRFFTDPNSALLYKLCVDLWYDIRERSEVSRGSTITGT